MTMMFSFSLPPVVACDPIQVDNAALKVTGVHNRTLQYDDVLHFECEEGYILQGESRSQCLSNGKWSSEVPMCQPLPQRNPF